MLAENLACKLAMIGEFAQIQIQHVSRLVQVHQKIFLYGQPLKVSIQSGRLVISKRVRKPSQVRPSDGEMFDIAKVRVTDLCTQLLNTETRERTVEQMTTVENSASFGVDLPTHPQKLGRARMGRSNSEAELSRAGLVWNGFNNSRGGEREARRRSRA